MFLGFNRIIYNFVIACSSISAGPPRFSSRTLLLRPRKRTSFGRFAKYERRAEKGEEDISFVVKLQPIARFAHHRIKEGQLTRNQNRLQQSARLMQPKIWG